MVASPANPFPYDFIFRSANPGTTGGTAGTRQISAINLAGSNTTANNIGFTQVFSKRLFLANGVVPSPPTT